MKKTNRELVKILSKIRSDIGTLNPTDQDAIIQIGGALEQFVGEVPPSLNKAIEALILCLEALQAVYEQIIPNPEQLIQSISVLMVAGEQFIASPKNPPCQAMLAQASDNLRAVLQSSSPSTAVNSSLHSLDDIATLLMQIEPHHQDEITRIHQAFIHIQTNGSFPTNAHKLLIQAITLTEELLDSRGADGQTIISDIGRLIEEFTYAMEAPASQAPPTAAVEPSANTVEETTQPLTAASVNGIPQFEGLPPDADLNLLAEFVTESREYNEGAEAALLLLETDPDNLEMVNTVFRAFHTIKGTSAFLGLKTLAELAHRAESLLSRIRDREIRYTGGYADLALRSLDMMKELLQNVQNALSGNSLVKPAGYDELLECLADPKPDNHTKPLAAAPAAKPENVVKIQPPTIKESKPALQQTEPLPEPSPIKLHAVPEPTPRSNERSNVATTAEASVRVRTDRLDKLIDMVGELVIAHSMIAQDDQVVHGGHYELARKVAHTGKIVRELQDLSMGMRMVPLKNTFQKMARLVRDLSHKSGKHVEFLFDGEETEIDRNMVDIINDPLVHMVRNAVDHGWEAPEVREAKGKNSTGTVRLSAYHAGGNIVIELQDDGKGLDRDKILKKALEKGLIESDKALSDNEILNLIFAPGFSTADKVTDLSGRGVGMDVVKRNVEALRGSIDISSEPGRGCLFSIRLPLTLAITDGMLVKVGEERYIIPTVNIHLSFRPTTEALSTIAERGEMVLLRGELMPIFRLHYLFEINGGIQDPTKGLLVVVADGKRRCAILVDELLGQQQVVAKSLGSGMGKVQGVSGGAILGDGRVGLILDCAEIVAFARTPNGSERKNGICQSAA